MVTYVKTWPRWRRKDAKAVFAHLLYHPWDNRRAIEAATGVRQLNKLLYKMRPWMWEIGVDIVCINQPQNSGGRYAVVRIPE